jgi:uncharacterized Zn finger protein
MTADLAALGTRFRLLTDAKLRAGAGPTTFSRGQAYAAQGRVSATHHHRDVGGQRSGAGFGSELSQLRLELYVNRSELLWTGECTCPMEVECKHTVALAIVAQTDLRIGRRGNGRGCRPGRRRGSRGGPPRRKHPARAADRGLG